MADSIDSELNDVEVFKLYGHAKNVTCHMCYMSHVTHVTCHKYQVEKM